MAASYASRRDLRLTETRISRAANFQKCYQRLAAAAGLYEEVLYDLRDRSAVINFEHRITGNAIIHVVEHIMKLRDDVRRDEIQSVMDRFIASQVLLPGQWQPIDDDDLEGDSARARLLRGMQAGLEECKETV
jgi:hypothetical protein